MNIELGIMEDGGVMLAADSSFPEIIKRVEFYRDQRLFLLVYDNADLDSDLMHFEVPQEMVYPVEKSPNVIMYSVFPDHPPIGYTVPLIKVGDLY